MASLPLYRVKPGIRAPHARFPEDFLVVGFAIVDDTLINHPDIASHRWSMLDPTERSKKPRAKRMANINGKRTTLLLHRALWEIVNGKIPNGLTIDHKNRDSLDNRIENLRLATQEQQGANILSPDKSATGYKGVKLYTPAPSRPRSFHARICPKTYPDCCLGYHPSPHHAAFAYNCGASLYYGEFAALNEIPDGLVPLEDQIKIQESVKNKLIARKLIDPKSLQTSSHA